MTKVAFYADDFTGATDALAQFTRCGLSGVLLTSVPASTDLARFAGGVDVVGVAGTSRALPSEHLRAMLTGPFRRLVDLSPEFFQYKVCSTFDSSPEIGSIGRAIEVAREIGGRRPVPVVPAQPDFGRYTAFGTHFTRAGERVYRLDRHPTVSRHPITPMREADLIAILATQTSLPAELVDITVVDAGGEILRGRYQAAGEAAALLVLDALQNRHLQAIAGTVAESEETGPRFIVGSGGISHGVGRHLVGAGPTETFDQRRMVAPTDRLLVLSGSASPQTSAQITAAVERGWAAIRLDTASLLDPDRREEITDSLSSAVVGGLSARPGVIVYTADGPADPVITRTREGLAQSELSSDELSRRIGRVYAEVIEGAVSSTGVERIIVAGGDTSGHTVTALQVDALEILAVPYVGGALCRVIASSPRLAGLELMLKGGQVGPPGLFDEMRSGNGESVKDRRVGA